MQLSIDVNGLEPLRKAFAGADARLKVALSLAVNRAGAQATTAMVRELTGQTGLKRKTIVKALRPKSGSAAAPGFTIRSAGGNVSLKYFGAKETRKGVSAAPWGHRQVYAGSFMKGGRFPKRVPAPRLHGQVFIRTGSGKVPIRKLKSGLFIPTEMTRGATAAAFFAVVEAVLPARLDHEVARALSAAK